MVMNHAIAAGVVLGFGMGGFVDGILLHMILRWHHMLSNIIPPDSMAALHTNMLWDGLFHALTWSVTLVGIFMLWNVTRRHADRATELPSTKSFVGSLALGSGLFNLIEGVIERPGRCSRSRLARTEIWNLSRPSTCLTPRQSRGSLAGGWRLAWTPPSLMD